MIRPAKRNRPARALRPEAARSVPEAARTAAVREAGPQ